jgi:hypothetical protein
MDINRIYNMDTVIGNVVYEKNYITDISRFTVEQQDALLNGDAICLQEAYYDEEGNFVDAEYTCIHEYED